MPIALGTLDVPKISLGDTAIAKVSLGDQLVWPAPSVVVFDHLVYMSSTDGLGSSTNDNLPLPEDRAVGDLAIFYQSGRALSGGSPPNSIPSGATSIVTFPLTSQNSVQSWSFKLLDANDVANGYVPGGITVASGGLAKSTILFRGYASDGTTVAQPSLATTNPILNTTASGAGAPTSQVYTAGQLSLGKSVIIGGYMSAGNQMANTGFIDNSGGTNVGTFVSGGPSTLPDSSGYFYKVAVLDTYTVGMTDTGTSNVRLAGIVYCEA